MDLLKKHWEKLLLLVVLLGVIGATGWLMMRVSDLNEELLRGRRTPPRKGETALPVNPAPYTKAITDLENPFQWEAGVRDLFVGPLIVDKPVDTDTVTNVQTRLKLLAIDRVPFKMNFKAYIGAGRNFQVDFKFRPKTFFVEEVDDMIGDQYEDTGYKVIKFEKKFVDVYNPSTDSTNHVDVSELTIQRAADKPIVLTVNREAEEEEPVATVRCESVIGGSADFHVRRGQQFNCGGKTYKVVDITSNGMVIINIQTEEKQTLPVSRE